MVEFITGVPGSGKTYRAMLSLYTNFGLNKSKIKDKSLIHNDVKHALTNINEIDTSKFEKNKVKHLDWDTFFMNLTQLHTMYKSKATDSDMLPIAEELGLKDVLIIVDECHNFLDNQNAVLVWWISYHRHFHQQIYLITQNLALVNSKYKSFSEFFYKARPSSLKLFRNKMVYFQYTDSRMSQKSKSGTIKLPIVNEVFDSYGSGANQQSQNLLKKFGILAVLLIGFMIFMFMMIQSYWAPSNIPKEERLINSNLVNAQIKNKPHSIIGSQDEILINILCSDTFNTCIFKKQTIPYSLYNEFKKIYKYKVIHFSYIKNSGFIKIYIKVNDDFINLFQQEQYGVQNENTTNNSLSLFPSSSSK